MLRLIVLFLITISVLVSASKPGRIHSMDEVNRIPVESKPRIVMLVLPPLVPAGREKFGKQAFDQIAHFLRKYDFLVPSWLQIQNFLKEHSVSPEDYPKVMHALAEVFGANKIFFLDIQKLSYQKKINPAGLLASGILLSGYGRYVQAEYRLDIYDSASHVIESLPAVERTKDYTLGLLQTSEKLAMDSQRETIAAMLTQYAQASILRPKGYILEPLEKTFVDSKGFQ
ncbi:MAG: hypothetical protein H3C47_12545 [Candidatus Cloacimonetes bacterium]|nr:hypothetical protein [Candidatus Cloacimonadota bacterium]